MEAGTLLMSVVVVTGALERYRSALIVGAIAGSRCTRSRRLSADLLPPNRSPFSIRSRSTLSRELLPRGLLRLGFKFSTMCHST